MSFRCILIFWSAFLSFLYFCFLLQRSWQLLPKNAPISLNFSAVPWAGIQVRIEDLRQISEQDSNRQSRLASSDHTELMDENLALQSNETKYTMTKHWHSDLSHSNRQCDAATVTPSCCKRVWCFEVCNSSLLKIRRAEIFIEKSSWASSGASWNANIKWALSLWCQSGM